MRRLSITVLLLLVGCVRPVPTAGPPAPKRALLHYEVQVAPLYTQWSVRAWESQKTRAYTEFLLADIVLHFTEVAVPQDLAAITDIPDAVTFYRLPHPPGPLPVARVYLVRSIKYNEKSYAGFATQVTRVVAVAASTKDPTTLAHELGHTLGLPDYPEGQQDGIVGDIMHYNVLWRRGFTNAQVATMRERLEGIMRLTR